VDGPGSSPPARGYEFEQFVLEILKRSPDFGPPVTISSYGRDAGFDLAATHGGRTLLVEAKITTPQTIVRLREAIAQLEASADRYVRTHDDVDPELVLAFPGVLSGRKTDEALSSKVTVWDGRYLRAKASELGFSVPPYIAPAETTEWQDEDSALGHSLLSQLRAISPGAGQWASYEKYCEELLNYLFVPPLNTTVPQSRDEQHANRRDFILPNYVMDGTFWQFMRSHYDAHYVVAEVKNLTGGPGKREILQVANYLNPHGTGLFSIILARHAMDTTAKWICREQWVQHNKLIVGLDDDDVRQMLVTKLADGDPAELIRQKIEDFRLGI
jgi:hypothetical protein